MEKPLVSARDWRLAALRLARLIYSIDTRQLGDPLDDLWFNFDLNELEIGVKPSRGVFLGEVREFHIQNDPETIFDSSKFLNLYGELADQGVFKEDETVDFDEHPLRKFAVLLEDACKTFPENKWGKVNLWTNASFTDGKFLRAPYTDIEFPVGIGNILEFLERVGAAVPPYESSRLPFESVSALFDLNFYITRKLMECAEEIRQEIKGKFFTERNEYLVYVSRGATRIFISKDKEDSDYPYLCGTLGSLTNQFVYLLERGLHDVFRACVAGTIFHTFSRIRTDGWDRRV